MARHPWPPNANGNAMGASTEAPWFATRTTKLAIINLQPIYQIRLASDCGQNKNRSATSRNTCSGRWCDRPNKRHRPPQPRRDENSRTSLRICQREAKPPATIRPLGAMQTPRATNLEGLPGPARVSCRPKTRLMLAHSSLVGEWPARLPVGASRNPPRVRRQR